MTAEQRSLPFHQVRRNQVIEAGAGTGKTTEIVGQVLSILLADPAQDPERIVLVTFTEKAAAQLAERVRGGLTELHDALSSSRPGWPRESEDPIIRVLPGDIERIRSACESHLAKIDRIQSRTIHSFCQNILRLFPIEAGVGPGFKVLETFERNRLYDEVFRAWLNHETVVDPRPEWAAQWELAFEQLQRIDEIRKSLLRLMERRHLLELTGYSVGTAEDVEKTISFSLEAIRAADRSTMAKVTNECAIEIATHVQKIAPPNGGSIEDWIAYFAPIEDYLTHFDLKAAGGLKPFLKTLREKLGGDTVIDRLRDHRATMAMVEMALRFTSFLETEKLRRGSLDFDDLLLKTLQVLQDPAIASAVRRRSDFIFVDEFQDTDRVQSEIFDTLARGDSGDYVRGKLVVVGDPKQSIYAFRRADPESYVEFVERLTGGGAEPRYLTRQYRSDPELVESFNRMFARLFPPQLAGDRAVARPRYVALEAAREETSRPEPRLTFLLGEADKKELTLQAEAEAIVSWAREHQAKGNPLSRVALLFRRRKYIDAYLEVFDRFGLPYQMLARASFLDSPAAVDLLAVLRAIAHPFDKAAMISAARSPWFALTDDEIVDHFTKCESPHSIPCEFTGFANRLSRYRDASAQLTVVELIDVVTSERQIELLHAVYGNGSGSQDALERFRENAGEYDETAGGSLAQFVEEVLRRRDDLVDPEQVEIDPHGTDAVTILTVHGAKGLEFDTVVLPELAFSSVTNELKVFTVEDPPSLVVDGGGLKTISSYFRSRKKPQAPGEVAPASEEEKFIALSKIQSERDKAETERLFYVAVTRARSDVVFVCSSPSRMNSGFWEILCRIFDFDPRDFIHQWPAEPGSDVRDLAGVRAAFVRPASPAQSEKKSHHFLSDAIASLADSVPLPETEPELPPIFEPSDPLQMRIRLAGAANRPAGILLHRFFECWDGIQVPQQLLLKLAAEQGASAGIQSSVSRAVSRLISSPAFNQIKRATTVARELSIYYRSEEGSDTEGRIDRLLLSEGEYVVVDYKRGRPHPARLDRDREQVQRYCAAIASMTAQKTRGMLWYIDEDHDQLVEC